MSLYSLVRPLIFALDAERAHRATIAGLRLLPARRAVRFDPRLAIRLAGIDFPSPVGLAAGFDKDAQVADAMLARGFGFVEVGTLTPQPQAGNPRPRLFRLAEDRAVINRMGFNNGGQAAALERLLRRRGDASTPLRAGPSTSLRAGPSTPLRAGPSTSLRAGPSTSLRAGPSTSLRAGPSTSLRAGIVGVNIGANKDAADRVADYANGVRVMAQVADYLTINISSPNTPGLRALQSRDALDELLDAIAAARGPGGPPVFLKLAPDLARDEIGAIAEVAMRRRIDALIVSNTTISRPPLASAHAGEAGGLSGRPLRDLALAVLRDFRIATGGALPLIAAGGIADADDAWARIRAGASLVQLYSALVYEGPGLARRIAAGLLDRMARDGFATLTDAVGADG